MAFTVKEFFKRFPNDAACLDAIMHARMGGQDRMSCPGCGADAKWYRIEGRRAYACQFCGHHYYPCVGTPFEDSRTSLLSWFYAMFLFTSSRHGVPAKELERQLGVTYKTAWRMGHQLRKLMVAEEPEQLRGHIEIDETLVGGKQHGAGTGKGRLKGKAILMGLLERDGGIVTRVVPNVKRETVSKIIYRKVRRGSHISTDELPSYDHLGTRGYKHGAVNHRSEEWVRGTHHTNSIEGLWSRLKASIRGTHIHVSAKHLDKYAAEFGWRFSERGRPDEMFDDLFVAASKRRKLPQLDV